MNKLIEAVEKELTFAVQVLIEAHKNREHAITGYHVAEGHVWGLKSKLADLKKEPTVDEGVKMVKPPKMHGADNYAGKGGA